MTQYIEDVLPPIQSAGLNTLKNTTLGGTLAVTGATTFAGGVSGITDLTTTGNTILGNAVSDTTTINGVATVTSTATVVGVTTTGGIAAKTGTAVPATAGAVAAGPAIGPLFTSGINIWVTSDAPTHTATKGDLCINTGGSSSSTRLYINNGTTTWIAVTTAS